MVSRCTISYEDNKSMKPLNATQILNTLSVEVYHSKLLNPVFNSTSTPALTLNSPKVIPFNEIPGLSLSSVLFIVVKPTEAFDQDLSNEISLGFKLYIIKPRNANPLVVPVPTQ